MHGSKCPHCEKGTLEVIGYHNLNGDEDQEIVKCNECDFIEA